MFPNEYNMPFFTPYPMPRMGLMGLRGASKGGIFSKLTGLKSINWQGLLNNTSKTLGIINQAIPVVKQVGPMYNNMKSMLKVASLFKDETDPPKKKNNKTNNISATKNNNINKEKENTIVNDNYSNTPNFFI